MLNKVRFLISALSLIEINMCCHAAKLTQKIKSSYVIFVDFKSFLLIFKSFY
jgi:hypothetical protein